jgi:bla regulator protein blaR1
MKSRLAEIAMRRGAAVSPSLRRAFVIVCLVACGFAQAQAPAAPPPAWQTAAGGKMEFEVASIRRSEPGTFLRPNMVLNAEDTPVPAGGLFVANFSLLIFIEFAWKVMPTLEQERTMVAHLPKWVAADHFVIRAQFSGNPTKDQVRLMMQSLLIDRFRLAVHLETHDAPVFALVPVKPGRLGPRIRPHAEGAACGAPLTVPVDRTSASVPPGGFLPACGRVLTIDGPNHTVLLGTRNITLDHLAGYLADFGNLDRPIVNQTGLTGTYDFSLNWLPEHDNASAAPVAQSLDAQGPSFIEALKDDLGLRLRATRAPIETLVIDHVEEPTPN